MRCRIRICEILRRAFSREIDRPDEAKRILLSILTEHVHCKYASLWTYHQETNTLHLGATMAPPGAIGSAILPVDTPAGSSIRTELDYAHFHEIGNESSYRDRRLISEFDLTHMYSFRLGPDRAKPDGVVCLYPSEAMTLVEAIEFAEICRVAYSSVALSIDRLRLALINELGVLVSQKSDVGSFLYKTLDVIRSRLPMEAASIFLWDEQNDCFRLSKTTGLRNEAESKRVRYRSADPCYQNIVSGNTQVFHQEQAAELYRETVACERTSRNDYHTVALVPIKDALADGRVVGFMRLANELNRVKNNDPDYFSKADQRVFEECASAIASGLHYYAERHRVRQTFAFFVHEVGAPIQGIEAKCERLLNPTLFRDTKEQNKTNLEDIDRYAAVLKELLLQYSVLGVEQLDIHIDDRPAHILQDILVPCVKASIHEVKKRSLRTRLEDGRLSIHYEAKEFSGVAGIYVDRIRMRQVFSNLLKNAVKYHNKKMSLFEVGIYCLPPSEGNYRILVCDTGMGIREEIRDKVFQKDFRSPEARRRDVFGTGLGLHLVKVYVEKHGGKVKLLGSAEMSQHNVPSHFVTGFLVELPVTLSRR